MLSPPELAARRAGITLEQAFSIDQVRVGWQLAAVCAGKPALYYPISTGFLHFASPAGQPLCEAGA